MSAPVAFEAMQFNGMADYFAIFEWMKASGDTNALANEVRFSTPLMLIYGPIGLEAAEPGDWIARMPDGRFTVLRSAWRP
jgi:hypothetical protein